MGLALHCCRAVSVSGLQRRQRWLGRALLRALLTAPAHLAWAWSGRRCTTRPRCVTFDALACTRPHLCTVSHDPTSPGRSAARTLASSRR
ncbi:hypothetical protein EXIGLDRAFT_717772 [Exidia glandulosa HHB12029]|uniref:Uncharacterized protein n=1 Tax=Exidia glandulosa HHB12029 TaxID=1314781 RepID=A0A165I576_EXIGL|nr:hypothetical protein EXIGLDRAFT_717772 [Exidia glandulosa HHB12029]